MKPKPPNAGKGRVKGVPNKATVGVRKAFQMLVEGNLGQLQSWLTRVAEGIKEPDLDEGGKPICGEDGEPILQWMTKPDPAAAMKLVMDLAEYHIPKLARIEHTGELAVKTVSELTDAELARIATAGRAGAVEQTNSPPDPAGVH